MGQKSNPIGLRLAVNKDWASKWYADKKTFASYLAEDRARPTASAAIGRIRRR